MSLEVHLDGSEVAPTPGPVPAQARGRSHQDYGTPSDFLDAVTGRFGAISFDLAASAVNSTARHPLGANPPPSYFTEADDSLKQDWTKLHGNLWLNPRFADIAPWARKCRDSTRVAHAFDRILLLTPASIGAEWFAQYVDREAMVLGLVGRLTFVGCEDPYPKDCILSCYGERTGFDLWRWKR